MIRLMTLAIVSTLLLSACVAHAVEVAGPKWKNGIPNDASFFPVAVWLQAPHNAAKFKAAGINVYVALWQGPTEEQLKALTDADIKVICSQNEVGLKHKDDKTIIGWMHGDEPDNAQALPDNKGYGPPIKPEVIVEDYKKVVAADPTRPVLLNLGQGVAWDGWYGRGTRTNHPEDYAEYAKGGDIISYDIYPVTHDKPDVKGKLWMVADGVERLRKWTDDKKIVWNCIECTRGGDGKTKASPEQIRSEVWMSLIAGSKGIIYFVHEFTPFKEAALLDDPENLKAVTAINAQIKELAPILNRPSMKDVVTASPEKAETPISTMLKDLGATKYLFTAATREGPTAATFTVKGADKGEIEVLGENRKLVLEKGQFKDDFKGYDVHIYKITTK